MPKKWLNGVRNMGRAVKGKKAGAMILEAYFLGFSASLIYDAYFTFLYIRISIFTFMPLSDIVLKTPVN